MDIRRIHRKNEHLALSQRFYKTDHERSPFHDVRLIHTGLPEMSVNEVDTHVNLVGRITLQWPFYIEAMTGGTKVSRRINRQLAQIAADHNLAVATGSMSIAFDTPGAKSSFTGMRDADPRGNIFANLSAGASLADANKAVKMINADALELHANAAQELIMPEGARRFHCLDNIEQIINDISVPVMVKEVGFGMSKKTVELLLDTGVSLINVGGRGGTNFARIENERADANAQFTDLDDWGQTTPESLLEARSAIKNAHHLQPHQHPQLIAAGGITSPLDVIKAGAMGASACGVAGYFLHILIHDGPDALDNEISRWQVEIPRIMTLLGCRRFSALRQVPKVYSPTLLSYAEQRHLLN